ncbi:MAG: YebC/PmpR family DNA-binding transcriptional regulator [Patescibacteria group bacterium]|nr:YebC/PmpR family DNA-binding transcriptional regulator [Patescibacteria group bacterium]
MSGHSKWSSIKRQKSINDQKRGKTFTKLANAITIAVKQGGGIAFPDSNFRLRLAIDAARAANMPKDNIERALRRAQGKQAEDFEEVIYEGFAPGGVSVIVEAFTDNPLRTTSEIKSIFHKAGASFGQPGSVSYQFKHVGEIIIKKNGKSYDDIFAIAVESGAEDLEDAGDEVLIYTDLPDLAKVKDALAAQGLEVVEAGLVRQPVVTTAITDKEKFDKIEAFLNTLEELDDVQKVYSNMDVSL